MNVLPKRLFSSSREVSTSPRWLASTGTVWLLLAGLGAGCAPSLTGEACRSDCNCPNGNSCLLSGNLGTCQPGQNTCVGNGATGSTGQTTGASASSSGTTGSSFAGTVVLNGGAAPVRDTWVYGYPAGSLTMVDGGYRGYTLFEPLPASDTFGFTAAGTYSFEAEYDLDGDGDAGQVGGDSVVFSADIASGTSAAGSITLDVQTSTCFAVTVEFATSMGSVTLLDGVGARIYDITNGQPLTSGTDLDIASAVLDAGSSSPGGPGLASLTLSPIGTVTGDTFLSNSWDYAPANGAMVALPNAGSFLLLFNDATKSRPQYPNGYCIVSYADAPALPQHLRLNNNGQAQMPTWVTSMGQVVSWGDPLVTLPAGVAFVGDSLSINDRSGATVYPPPGTTSMNASSPMQIPGSALQANSCPFGGPPCTLYVVSFFEDHRGANSISYVGGATALSFNTL